ncbi:MAG: potassium transporter TrkG, partial [Anaerovoracaceae bacterium]
MKNVLIQRIADGSTYGKLMILVGVLIACPLVILIFYPSEVEYAAAFAVPALVSVAQGVILCIVKPTGISRRKEWQSLMQEGSAPVLFTWAYAFLLGAIPFVVAGELPFIPALFEAVSGWTTTGLTVVDVSKLPHIFLFHRSFMQFSGGMGFVIMIAMIIKGKQSVSLYSAEGHPDKIRPSLRETARTIFRIDMICLVIGSTAFTILGMPLFDSICHTMSALSTAG